MKTKEYLTKSCMIYWKVKASLSSVAHIINKKLILKTIYYYIIRLYSNKMYAF